jgi:hypothetical protein
MMIQSPPPPDKANLADIVAEIQQIMSGYIPDFAEKFSTNVKEAAIEAIRAERSFAIRPARALVFGETGVGKTTTINYLLSNPIFPTSGELSCTKSLACGQHQGGLIFYDSPGLGDDEGLENVTRAALGLDYLADEPIETVTLLDITAKNEEGPADYVVLPYTAFQAEISADFYQAHQAQIVAKQFELATFEAWAAANFDFMVFVTSSQRGLPSPIAKILSAFEQRRPARLPWFKVYNVFGGQYNGEVASLEAGSRSKFEQAQARSQQFGLTGPEQWFIIDSQSGVGVAELIRAMAEALPLEVLRSLTQVVKARYSHLIEEKIASYFFDYTAHVAALLAVFPVDHAEQGERFLKFALDSLLTMARFMFARPGKGLAAGLVNELAGELEFSKRRAVYQEEVHKRKKASLLLNLADKVGKQVNRNFDAYAEFNGYEIEQRRVAQETYFAVGGVDAIQLILGLGLTLTMVHHPTEAANWSPAHFQSMLEANRRVIEANLAFHARSNIIRLTRNAAGRPGRAEKRQMAAELYPTIRAVLAAAEGA